MARRNIATSDDEADHHQENGTAQSTSTKAKAGKRGAGKDKERANGREASVEDDDEEEEEEEDDDDQGEGSPRGKKRARANTTGDSIPGGSQRLQVKTQPRDTDGYIPGSIVRIQLENFVTYDYVEFRPGPYLNMILGPNGTGKSSIACAICIGLNFPAKTLGRANDVHHFVKNTAEKGYVELELKGPKGRQNIIIRRNLTANSKTTTFTINGKSASGREVSEQVEKLNVQVGNKCTFLPQDKVSEFAAMTPQELLRETQKAAGNENLTRWHEILISSGKDLKELQASLDSDKATLKTAQDRNAALERDVERVNERQKLEQQQTLLEVLIPVQQYREMRVRYRDIKSAQRVAVRKLQALKEKNAPMLQFKEDLENKWAKTNNAREKAKARMSEKMKALRTKKGANDRLEARAEDITNELKNLKREEKIRQKKITDTTADMEKFSAEVETLGLVQLENDDEIRDEIQQINQEARGVRQRMNEVHAKLSGNADRHGSQTALIRQADAELAKLNDVSHRRMTALRNFNRDHHDAVLWLRANKNRFQMEIFEPLFISVSVKDPRRATAMEGLIPADRLKTFVAQCQEDYDLFNKHINDEACLGRKVNINSWYRPINFDRVQSEPMNQGELRACRFDGYALDFLEYPEGLRPFLVGELQLHRAAIGPSNVDVNKAMELVTRGSGAQFVAGTTLNIVKRSAYGKKAAFNSTRDLRPAKTFVDPAVDPTQKQKWNEQKQEAIMRIGAIEDEDAQLKEQEKEIRKEDSGFQSRMNNCKRRRDTIQAHKTKTMRAEENLKKAQRQYKEAIRAPSLETKSEGLKKELGEVVRKRKGVASEYAHLAREILTENMDATRLALKALQVKANIKALEEINDRKQAKYHAALQEFQQINEEFEQCKLDSRKHLEVYKTVVAGLESPIKEMYEELELPRQRYDTAADNARKAGQPEPEPPEGMDTRTSAEMQNEMEAVEAKLELTAGSTNKGVIDQYSRRKEEIENLSQTIDEKERRVARVERDITNAKENWLPALKKLVNSIGQKFSASFDRIGCAGEVRIGEHEDFDKWTIDILVKFRDSEKLQLLTAQRQSGGERALTTILYLLSLTAEARAPFSLVDEINQGMDARAERMVHNSMVQATCQEDSAQYFLITPKLLTDLEYHKRMKVLCVNNGEWLPDEKETGVQVGSLMGLIDGYLRVKSGGAANSH